MSKQDTLTVKKFKEDTFTMKKNISRELKISK